MISSTIGKYKITRLIGEGGMSSVYEAQHEMLCTKVAIKVLVKDIILEIDAAN